MRDDIRKLIAVYDERIKASEVTPETVLWPNAPDLAKRFEVLLGPVSDYDANIVEPTALLDLGCGPGFLLDYLAANRPGARFSYTGVDVTPKMVEVARARWPQESFEVRDIRDQPFPAATFDFAVMCGVLTAKFASSQAEMTRLAKETLEAVWPSVRQGLAFNVMSKHVDWERDDLFHWPLDEIMAFCKARLSRHVSFRLDYGLWETAVFVRKAPVQPAVVVPPSWLGER